MPGDPQLQEAIRQGAADAQDIMNARISAGAIRNGWRFPDPHSGLAGPHLLARAVVQATQMGLFPLQEAIYFFAYRDGENQTLHGSQRYIITFKKEELPPLREFGFWSLTMYNEVSLLVENALNRYIIRPDSPGLATAPDGSLTLYIQHDMPGRCASRKLAARSNGCVQRRAAGCTCRKRPSLMGRGSSAYRVCGIGEVWTWISKRSCIVQEAFIYGYPMVDMYNILYKYAVDTSSPEYKAPLNTIYNTRRLMTPEDTAIVAPVQDTPYSYAWLDLRAE